LATTTLHLAAFAQASAAANWGASVQGVGALPRFGFDKFGGDRNGFIFGKALDCRPLRFNSEAGALLLTG
jgi:hypothetical protein